MNMKNSPTLEVLRNARTLWDYHNVKVPIEHVDFILAMGSHDERVANCAASMFLHGYAPLLVTSGGYGKVTKDIWKITEGERFALIAEQMGVPRKYIIVEPQATNTGANLVLTREILQGRGIDVRSALLVTKPYMSRRALAAAERQWPEIKWLIAAPDISFDEYPNSEVSVDRMINLMVGDLQRLKVYADQGFQTPQIIPDFVWASYDFLRDAGYNEFVIADS
jgi:uncharacterized SAM-binding protein YcdF (DUF218 family)